MDRLRLDPAPASVGEARRFSEDWVRSEGVPELVEVVALVVSELVTNVVLHARTSFELTLEHRGDRLRVSVADRDPGAPARRAVDVEAGSGRGLQLVHAVALDTGHELTGEGKQVWCEIGWPLG